MIGSSLTYALIRSLPESILFILAGFILLDLSICTKKIFKYGLLFGIIITAIRMLPLTYGIHTVLGMMIGGLILTKISNMTMVKPIIATCGIFISLALSEGIYIIIATEIINIPQKILMGSDYIGAILSIPSLLIFICIIIIMKLIMNKIRSR